MTIIQSLLGPHPHPEVVLTFSLEQRLGIPHIRSQPFGQLLKNGIEIKNLSTGASSQLAPISEILHTLVKQSSVRDRHSQPQRVL